RSGLEITAERSLSPSVLLGWLRGDRQGILGSNLLLKFSCPNQTTISGGDLMRSTHRGRLVSVILVCLLFSSVPAQDESQMRPTAASDDAALRALVQEFYGSYAKKDLDGFLRLWSVKSPELTARRETMQKLFADNEKIEIKGLVIRQMAVEGEKAKLRVELEMSAIEVKTSKPATGLGKMVRALGSMKEEGAWKVWREASAEEDLAAALALLKTEA